MGALNNERHEKYCVGLMNGLSQRKAYRAAFPTAEKWKDSTVDARACELAKDSKIIGRLQELQKEATSRAVMTATQRKEWLTKLIQSEDEATQNKLKAVDILNKMDGEYTEKLQVNGNINNPMSELTTEELKKLIADD